MEGHSMSKNKQLTKKQLAVIEDLFNEKLSETEILKKNNISRFLYNKWLADRNFIREFDNRIMVKHMRNNANITRSVSNAIKNLEEMAGKNEGETARKACLDIIALEKDISSNRQPEQNEDKPNENEDQLSDEAAGRFLAALAEEKQLCN
jgi:hypothetical protein